jgi:hypothetical protein
MSIETAVFAVQRGGQQFSCKGSELREKLTDGDILLVNRGGVDYQYILEEQGVLKLIKDVDFGFNDQGAIVITQNAEARGGDTPYKLATEYDIVMSDAVLEKPLEGGRVPTAADILNGTPYISFGSMKADSVDNPQEIYSLNIEQAEFNEEFINKENGISFNCNNRFGLRSLTFEGKDILIDVYNSTGSNTVQWHQFIYFGLDEKLVTPRRDWGDYIHLRLSTEQIPCSGFVSDKDGNIYSGWYRDGLYRHENIPADSLGYPDFTDTSITSTRLVTSPKPGGLKPEVHYYKGLVYHEQTNRILWSTNSYLYAYSIESGTSYTLNTRLQTDDDKSVALNFTCKYVIRTIIEESGNIKSSECGEVERSNGYFNKVLSMDDILYLNDPDNKYLFKLVMGKTIKMLDYNYTGDPIAEDAPWEEFRPEPLPYGKMGGFGAIMLEPFNLMWYQGDKLKSWGNIPDRTSEASVYQTITDANGDSVTSSTTKVPAS